MGLTDHITIGCAAMVVDGDGIERPCGRPIVAVRRWTGCGDGDGIGGVCAEHAAELDAELVPLGEVGECEPKHSF